MANYELLISELKSGRFMQTVVARRVKKSGVFMGLDLLLLDEKVVLLILKSPFDS